MSVWKNQKLLKIKVKSGLSFRVAMWVPSKTEGGLYHSNVITN